MKTSKQRKDITSMPITKTTLERIKRLCLKGETYDTFLNKVLDLLEAQQ
jgi:hypothetical protein